MDQRHSSAQPTQPNQITHHPNGTAIEGEWQPVFAAIEACHQAVHAMGCPRVYTT